MQICDISKDFLPKIFHDQRAYCSHAAIVSFAERWVKQAIVIIEHLKISRLQKASSVVDHPSSAGFFCIRQRVLQLPSSGIPMPDYQSSLIYPCQLRTMQQQVPVACPASHRNIR